MKLDNIEDLIIFECISGSQLYGLDTPESDIDYRGVCLPSLNVLLNPFNEFEQKDSGFDEEDRTIYSLKKFLKLCADNNPNIIELLFIPEDKVVSKTEVWDRVVENRDLFLSKNIKYRFTGYAFSQLKRIQNHRKWLVDPPKEKPTRKIFGLDGNKNISNAWKTVVKTELSLDIMDEKYHKEYKAEVAYAEAKRLWDNYTSWKKGRNPKRRLLEEKWGYDCYSEDTEFLTRDGWKKYDEIKDGIKVGTINKETHEIEFQTPNNRFKGYTDDNLFNVKTQSTNCLVTKNHNLFISPMKRSRKNNFSRKYEAKDSSWELKNVNDILSGYRSHYHVLNIPNNNNKEFDVSDDYLRVLGLYVSDGCLMKRKNKSGEVLKGISIAQLESPNKIKHVLDSINEFDIHKYSYERKNRNELTYNIYNADLANKIFEDCGEYSKSKRLPNWILKLSKRQATILLEAMISGDGTRRKYSLVYYTISPSLANSTQILAIVAGYTSKIWEYNYNNVLMHQVYISDFYGQYGNLKKQQIKEVEYSGNVVCFDVDNATLITRYKGECAFHGNTKHASHLFRLMHEGKELLLTGNLTFPLVEADEIRAIKNGKYEYNEMLELAKDMEQKFNMWYDESPLPKNPNRNALTKLYYEIIIGANKSIIKG